VFTLESECDCTYIKKSSRTPELVCYFTSQKQNAVYTIIQKQK